MTSSRPGKDDVDRLLDAAKTGNTNILHRMIRDDKYDVDTRGPADFPYYNGTLLLISCYHGKLKSVEKLLQLGANIEAVDQYGDNALHNAAVKGHSDVANLLLQKQPDLIMQTNKYGETVLHRAAVGGNQDIVDLLLKKKPDLITQTDNRGMTVLHRAAVGGNQDIVDLLLKKKPDLITQTDNRGITALHYAAEEGNPDVVELLLKKKPNVIVQTDKDGDTPLDWAVIMDKSAVVWTMVHSHKVDITQCCHQHRQEKAKRLLAKEEARRAKSAEEDTNALNQESLEVMLGKLEQAKANNETLKVSYTTVVFSGSSGVGKTSLLNKLNKEKLNKHHHSTGVAKSKHTICIKTTAVIESTQGLQWTELDYESLINHLHKYLHELKFPSVNSKAASLKPQENASTSDEEIHNPQISSLTISSSKDNASKTSRNEGAVKKSKEVEVDIAKANSSSTPSLGDVWDIINFLDTGGQPEFVNILPAVSSSIALTFIVFNLSESLDGLVHVKHNVNGDPSFKPYFLDCTNLEFIKRLMVSSENFNKNITPSVVLKGIQRKDGKGSAKICYVGTHALNVSEEKIKEIDQKLSSIAKELELQQRSFWCSPRDQLKRLFPIDLFPVDGETETFESIIEDIRDNIQREVKTQDYYEVPITWFIFLLKLQKLCNIRNASYITYQEATIVWMDQNVEEHKLGPNHEDQHEKVSRRNSEVHNVLLFFHLMGMLFYYHTVKGMCDFVFINRQWLFEKLTELVEIKFKGYNKKDINAEDVEKFIMEGKLSINIIKNLNINLQGISPLYFIHLLDHLNIIAPIDAIDYFMPCVLPSFSDTKHPERANNLDEWYGTIQYVSLLVGFKGGPMPHGFFCHLIVQLFKKLPMDWICPFLSTEEVQHVYNNLITFPTKSGHFVSLFYKIGYLEIQVRYKHSQPTIIHSDVQHELDLAMKKVCDHLQLNKEQLGYGFYCNCKRVQHFAKLTNVTPTTKFVQCRYSNTELTEDHRVWLQNICCHTSQQESKLIKIGQPNYQNLLPYFEDVSDWKKLGLHLLPETCASRMINDIDKNYKHDVAECRWTLITEYLKVGEVSWDKVIYALQKSGYPNIAKTIRSDIFNTGELSTRSTGHNKHKLSSNTTASDADVSAKPFTDHERHKQSPDTTATDVADPNTKPPADHTRHVQSHSAAAPQPSTKRRCLVM